jgi:hypothetical protein
LKKYIYDNGKNVETLTGYIHTLILEVSDLFMNLVWLFSISVLPLIIGTTSILLMVCKQSIITGIICLVIGFLAVYLKTTKVNEIKRFYMNAVFTGLMNWYKELPNGLETMVGEKIISMIKKYLNNKTYVIITHRPKIKELCNRHYVFEEHMMKEVITL